MLSKEFHTAKAEKCIQLAATTEDPVAKGSLIEIELVDVDLPSPEPEPDTG